MKRMATSIIEVRDGRVVNYLGDYEAYLYAVNKEIEEGERETATRMSKPPVEVSESQAARPEPSSRNEREIRKELNNIERTIARLDDQKKALEYPAHVGDGSQRSDAVAHRGSGAGEPTQ